MSILTPDAKPQSVKKFYFLEYFYILLKSIQQSSNYERIFTQFLTLKQKHQLGESRYKKLAADDSMSSNRMVRYKYTFDEVVSEAKEYGLISTSTDNLFLTDAGKQVIGKYDNGDIIDYNHLLFQYMEEKYSAFRYIVESCYAANPKKSGLLIFPVYSAHRLGIERDSIKTTGDLKIYFGKLRDRLQEDILKHLGEIKDISLKNSELIEGLVEADLLSKVNTEKFDASRYNVILKRGRDFWLKYFLQDLYNYHISLSVFETWAYRGRQIGIMHITEFYPDANFSGRVVYPLSVIRKSSSSKNFSNLFNYSDGNSLFLHQPSWEDQKNQEDFVKALHYSYLDVKQSARTYFVNLASVRERVCYKLKIPEYLFDKFLGNVYRERQRLNIKISLEVDKLPDETKVMYLRREPVMVDGKYRNIIAIDLV